MIPEAHTANECPACSRGTPCRVVTRGHLRYWDLYRADPKKWGGILIRDAAADHGRPQPIRPAPTIACRHRTARHGCETTWACGLGHGIAGIIEPGLDCCECLDAMA